MNEDDLEVFKLMSIITKKWSVQYLYGMNLMLWLTIDFCCNYAAPAAFTWKVHHSFQIDKKLLMYGGTHIQSSSMPPAVMYRILSRIFSIFYH